MFGYFFCFLVSQLCFLASPCKTMQNHLEVSSESPFLITYFSSNSSFLQIFLFDLQTKFVDGKTLFFRFLAEIRLRMPLESPQKQSSLPISCNFHRLHMYSQIQLVCRYIHQKLSFYLLQLML